MSKLTRETERLGPTFHRSFSLVSPALAQVLRVIGNVSKGEGHYGVKELLREETNLGTIYIDSMPRYGIGTGLLDGDTTLTSFGQAVLDHDPDLNHPATLWLMHYHLSAPKGPGPAFWHHLVTQVLHPGEQLPRTNIKEQLDTFLRQNGTELVEKSLNSTTTIFTGTYTKSDALGRLGILTGETEDNRSSTFDVQEPEGPPTFALGYALAHFWEQEVNALRTHLSLLSEPGGFASLFFTGNYNLNAALRELQREGYVELEQISPPHQIVRRWGHKEDFLERLYE